MASDSGEGALKDYNYLLVPRNKKVTITLAGSDPFQEELAGLAGEPSLQTFIAPRTIEEERTDAPMPVRFFTGRRMSGVVGYIPRGLEPVIAEALTRLEGRANNRIPAGVVSKRGRLRVILQLGVTR